MCSPQCVLHPKVTAGLPTSSPDMVGFRCWGRPVHPTAEHSFLWAVVGLLVTRGATLAAPSPALPQSILRARVRSCSPSLTQDAGPRPLLPPARLAEVRLYYSLAPSQTRARYRGYIRTSIFAASLKRVLVLHLVREQSASLDRLLGRRRSSVCGSFPKKLLQWRAVQSRSPAGKGLVGSELRVATSLVPAWTAAFPPSRSAATPGTRSLPSPA